MEARIIANKINIIVGGDIVGIKAVKPYPENYDAVVDQAKLEQKNKDMIFSGKTIIPFCIHEGSALGRSV